MKRRKLVHRVDILFPIQRRLDPWPALFQLGEERALRWLGQRGAQSVPPILLRALEPFGDVLHAFEQGGERFEPGRLACLRQRVGTQQGVRRRSSDEPSDRANGVQWMAAPLEEVFFSVGEELEYRRTPSFDRGRIGRKRRARLVDQRIEEFPLLEILLRREVPPDLPDA